MSSEYTNPHHQIHTKRSIQKEKDTLREEVDSESDYHCANKNKHEKLVTYNSYTNENSFPKRNCNSKVDP